MSSATPTVRLRAGMSPRLPVSAAAGQPGRAQVDSRAWVSTLRVPGPERDEAIARLHDLLDDYRGASRFTTWAYKFALLEAGVRLRRRAWQQREVALKPAAWPRMADAGKGPQQQAETGELMQAL